MNHIRRVHVLQAPQELPDNVSLVLVFEDFCANGCMQISVHEFEDHIEVAVVFCPDHLLHAKNIVVMSERPMKYVHPISALSVSIILERVQSLFQGEDLLSALMLCLPPKGSVILIMGIKFTYRHTNSKSSKVEQSDQS